MPYSYMDALGVWILHGFRVQGQWAVSTGLIGLGFRVNGSRV